MFESPSKLAPKVANEVWIHASFGHLITMKMTRQVNTMIHESDQTACEIKSFLFPNNIPSKKGKGNESGERKKYLCHCSIIVDVFNVQKPGNSVTVPIATASCLPDLVN